MNIDVTKLGIELLNKNEKFVPVKKYEEFYMVSNMGRVLSLPRQISYTNKNNVQVKYANKAMIQHPATDLIGYLHVRLVKPNEKPILYRVHNLVAQGFIENYDINGGRNFEVHHMNRNKE